MTAEIVSVGTELLLGQIIDTHAPVMARILAECGISCTRRTTIGDNRDRLVGALHTALADSDIVITIGGLGPTVDDLTRDAIAEALGDEMERVPKMEERLRRFFAQRDIRWTESIGRQADRPVSGRFIDNPNGTAPGLWCDKGGKTVIALPGPKGEFGPMADGPVREILRGIGGRGVIHSRVLRIIGMGESHVEDLIRDLMEAHQPTVAPYAHTGEVHLRVTARAETVAEADAIMEPVVEEIGRRLGHALYGADDEDLEGSVVKSLTQAGLRLATAESMTGGALAHRLVAVPGASKVFIGGVVAYAAEVKATLLGVPAAPIAEFGPVSGEVAGLMAQGVRGRLSADVGVSITGNAGPEADVDGKPIGLVFVALDGPGGLKIQEFRYRGVREDIQRRATQAALMMIREFTLAP